MDTTTTTTFDQPETRKPRRWPWIAGIVAALLVGIGIGGVGDDATPAAAEIVEVEVESQELLDRIALLEAELEYAEALADAAVGTFEEEDEPTAEPEPEPTVEPEPEPAVVEDEPEVEAGTVAQQNALRSAQQYLNFTAFSRSGLIEQLEFEGFSTDDATWAVDNVTVDWNEQAAKSAQQYLDFTSFSRSGLIEQLKYEGFTTEQAEHGVNETGL